MKRYNSTMEIAKDARFPEADLSPALPTWDIPHTASSPQCCVRADAKDASNVLGGEDAHRS
jgi:hypothetical protein